MVRRRFETMRCWKLGRLAVATRTCVMPAQPSSACTFNDELFHSGEPRRIMQADESVYLHPAQVRLPGPRPWWWARTTFHTTDVHRGKLALYESWGFPEVWAEVPDAPSPSRPHRRPSGLTIHLLERGRFRVAAASRAFPGWRAEEIYLALNEPCRRRRRARPWSGLPRRSARAKAPARTTTRCCARNGARGSSAAWRKVVHGWSARFCSRGALRCRRVSLRMRRRSPRRRRRRC